MSNHEDTQPFSSIPESGTDSRSGFHPVNIGHLVMGVAFLGLMLVWALVVGDAVAEDDIRWLLPVPWVSAGAAGLIAIVAHSRRRSPSISTPTLHEES